MRRVSVVPGSVGCRIGLVPLYAATAEIDSHPMPEAHRGWRLHSCPERAYSAAASIERRGTGTGARSNGGGSIPGAGQQGRARIPQFAACDNAGIVIRAFELSARMRAQVGPHRWDECHARQAEGVSTVAMA